MTQPTPAPRRIVVGVDSSDNAARAATWAAHEALALNLPLHLVHALDLPNLAYAAVEPPGFAKFRRDEGSKLLGRLADRLREQFPGLAVDFGVSDLGAPETLVTLSRDAALVVTGTRGHGGFAGLLLGSVSLKLAAHADSPVVVVRGEQSGDPRNEIVLGVEPDEAEAPIRFAFETAAALGAKLNVVRAWWPHPAYGGYYSEDADVSERTQAAEAEALVKALREEYPQVPVTTNAMRGNAVPMLIEAARGSRLLVVGAHRHRSPLSVGAGYVVQGLLSHSPTPVAVIPIA